MQGLIDLVKKGFFPYAGSGQLGTQSGYDLTGRRTDIPGPVLKRQVVGGLLLNSRAAGRVIRMAWRRRTVPKILPDISTILEVISELLGPVQIFLDGEA